MSKRARSIVRFVAAISMVVCIWGVVLPWLGQWDSVRHRIDTMQQMGVDPAAMFYTDLELTPEIQARMSDTHQLHGDAFWQID